MRADLQEGINGKKEYQIGSKAGRMSYAVKSGSATVSGGGS